MSKWGILFYFSFATFPATKDKKVGGEVLTWNTKEEAENWAKNNSGPICYESFEVKKVKKS